MSKGDGIMSGTRKWFSVVLIAGIALLLQCAVKERRDLPRAAIIVGNVDIIRNGIKAVLVKDQFLRPGDTVRVNDNAKLKLELQGDGFWYLGNSSELVIGEPLNISGSMRRLPAVLRAGQMHIVKRNDTIEEYSITTAYWIIRVTAADLTVGSGNDAASCCVSLLNGFATFMPPEGNETIIPPCSRLFSAGTGPGELQPITEDDIAQLKSWIGSSVIEEATTLSGCTTGNAIADASEGMASPLSTANGAPEWKTVPQQTAMFGEKVVDTVVAADPEQEKVTYALLRGIKGMTLNAETGVLKYVATPAGTHQIMIAAEDPAQNRCTTSVALSITKDLSVRLSAPKMVGPDELFTISAAIVGNTPGSKVGYRFDINGDGVFEVPGKGAFGRAATVRKQQLSHEGVYKIRAEIQTSDGKSASAVRRIVVNNPPTVVFTASPQFVPAGTPVLFDVSGTSDTRNGTTPLRIRFDLNGDGVFDIPAKNATTDLLTYSHTFAAAGTYTVTAQVTDMDGAVSTGTAVVTVSGGIVGGKIVGPDTVSVNKPYTFTCEGISKDFAITEYAWDFGGKGSYGKGSSAPTGSTTFKQAGTVTISCRVTDAKKQLLVLPKEVVVVNASTEISAGGPYKAAVNSALALTGTAQDPDNAIVSYTWDADGDGTADYTSEKEGTYSHTYKKAGTYKALFTITSDDGKQTSATAEVHVSNKAPKASAGSDIISKKNRKIELAGTGTDEDGSVVLYEWDFNGDGTYDWSSSETGTVKHAFEVYSKAVLRVKDSDGEIGTDTITIIVCPEDMETVVAGSFCIDTYEYPNKRNSVPRTDVTYEEARKICAKNGKRLCTASEWEMACNGNRKKNNYPYARKYDVDKCNTMGNPRLKNAIAPAGDFIECKGDQEVYDMSGNVAEWTQKEDGNAFAYGGSYQNGESGSGCTSRVKLQAGKKYFYTGFRCCK